MNLKNNTSSTRTRKLAVASAMALLLVGLPAFAAAQGVVNINSADAETLQLLPRVGPSTAQRIIAFRDENGGFKSAEELMLVQGIGERSFDQMSDYVVTDGESTLDQKVSAKRATSATADTGSDDDESGDS